MSVPGVSEGKFLWALHCVGLQTEHVLSTALEMLAVSISATYILPYSHTEVLKPSQNKANRGG